MSRSARFFVCISVVYLLCALSSAQSYPYSGYPVFSTQKGSPYDQVDLADGNISLTLPLRSINAGPMPLSFMMFGQSNAYSQSISQSSGDSWYITIPSFNLTSSVGAAVSDTLEPSASSCPLGSQTYDNLYTGFGVTDSFGTFHPINPNITLDGLGCYPLPSPLAQPTTDGSGYTIVFGGTAAAWKTTVYDKFGNTYQNVGIAPSGVTTPDGVAALTATYGGTGPNYTQTETDALTSTPVLTEVYGPNPGPTSVSYGYTNSAGSPATASYTAHYTSYTQATNFGCSGISEVGPGPRSFLTSITTPVGTYTFTYEPTPNNFTSTKYPAPYYTGRIASITLPTGGSISYQYEGGNHGINCTSGVVPTLIRTINDNNGNSNQWTYVNSLVNWPLTGYNFTVAVTDPAGNQTAYSFQGQVQTQAASYQGGCPTSITGCTGGGTLLKTVTTCYDAKFANCAAPSASIALPPYSQTDVYTSYNGAAPNDVETVFDANEDPLTVAQYDFGVTMGAAPSSALLLAKTSNYYGMGPWSGTACAAYPAGVYIRATPCYTVTTNSAGSTVSATQIAYSSYGHPTTTKKWVSGSSWLTASATYNSNGTVATSTSLAGVASTYYYNGTGGCSNLLLTSVVSGGLTNSTQWNCTGAVVANTTDPNGQITQYQYYDPLYRVTLMTDPMGEQTTYSYPTASTSESAMNFGTNSTVDTLVTTDGLGRKILSQQKQAPGSANFDTVNTIYSTNAIQVSMPYVGTAGQLASPGRRGPTGGIVGATPLTTTIYDAVGRPVTIANAANGTTAYTYNGNTVLQQTGNATTGIRGQFTIASSKQLQYNGMGQLTEVCEGTLTGTIAPCSGGYVTSYTHDPLGNILGVTQGSQTRAFVYDGLGRLRSETNPESETTTYTYDSTGCGSSNTFPGHLTLISYANGTNQCFQYNDPLGRVTAGTGYYSTTGASYCKRFDYDKTAGVLGTVPSGVTLSYPYGRLSEAETDNCTWPVTSSTMLTDEWFNYDQNGRNTDVYESTPNSAGYYHTKASYWANNAVNTLSGVPGLSSWTFTPDGEGRPFTATYNSSTPVDWVTGVSYWPSNNLPSGQTTVTYGDSDTDVYTLDSYVSGQVDDFQFNVGSTSLQGSLGWNSYGPLSTLSIIDGFNTANSQSCTYGYDGLLRVNSVVCNTSSGTNVWGQDFTFDAYGNISKSVPSGDTGTAFLPNYTPTTNQYTLTGCTPQVSYDLSGNLLNDCFNTYTWTGYNTLATMNSKTLTFDAFDREVEIGSGSAYSQVLYSPIGKLGLMNGQTPKATRYPLPGGGTAEVTGTGGTNHILHSDWLGSARLSTNYKGQTAENDTSYAPYGEAYNNINGTADFNFTGMMQDTGGLGGGLYDFPFREYSTVGRWISPDPAGLGSVDPTNPQTWNRYAYVMNNPLSNVDPLGLQAPVTMTNTQCANAQNPAICQGGYGTPGNLWATLGGSGGTWDEFGGITTTTTNIIGFTDLLTLQYTDPDTGETIITPLSADAVSQTSTNTWNIGSGGNPLSAGGTPAANNGQPQSPRKPILNMHQNIVVVTHPQVQPDPCKAVDKTAHVLTDVGAGGATVSVATGAPVNPVADFALLLSTGAGGAGLLMDLYSVFACP